MRGAKASAIIYSIVETVKENGLIPMKYVTYVLERLPRIVVTDEAELDQTLPCSTDCHVPKKIN